MMISRYIHLAVDSPDLMNLTDTVHEGYCSLNIPHKLVPWSLAYFVLSVNDVGRESDAIRPSSRSKIHSRHRLIYWI